RQANGRPASQVRRLLVRERRPRSEQTHDRHDVGHVQRARCDWHWRWSSLMTRAPLGSDFSLDVSGVGRFTFGRRTQKDKYLIRSQYSQLTNDYWKEDGQPGDMEAWMHATIAVLMVKAPDAFSLDNLDPLLDDETGKKIETV